MPWPARAHEWTHRTLIVVPDLLGAGTGNAAAMLRLVAAAVQLRSSTRLLERKALNRAQHLVNVPITIGVGPARIPRRVIQARVSAKLGGRESARLARIFAATASIRFAISHTHVCIPRPLRQQGLLFLSRLKCRLVPRLNRLSARFGKVRALDRRS